jgi:hypothetical protein
MVEETMNYTFLIVLAVFLVVTAPVVLFGAHREGKRRREAREIRSMRNDMPVHPPNPVQETTRPDPAPETPHAWVTGRIRALGEELSADTGQQALILRVYSESSWRGRGMILRVYQLRKDLPTNQVAEPESPRLELSELLYRAAERSQAAPKA